MLIRCNILSVEAKRKGGKGSKSNTYAFDNSRFSYEGNIAQILSRLFEAY